MSLNRGSGWGTGLLLFPYILPSWIHSCLRKADKNKDNKMSFKEVQNFLKELNIQVDDSYARKIFRVRQEVRAGCTWQWVLDRSPGPALSPAHLVSWLCRNVTTLRRTLWKMRRLRLSTRC